MPNEPSSCELPAPVAARGRQSLASLVRHALLGATGPAPVESGAWDEQYIVAFPATRSPIGANRVTAETWVVRTDAHWPGLATSTQTTYTTDPLSAWSGGSSWSYAGRAVGPAVWGETCVLSLPTSEVASEADRRVFDSRHPSGGTVVILQEAEYPTSCREAFQLVSGMCLVGSPPPRPVEATALPLRSAEQVPRPSVVGRDVHLLLRELARWTRLMPEQLGEMFGASRRTIYNWLAGRAIRDDAKARILRVHDLLAPLADSRDPLLIRDWILRGEPTPLALAASERWSELELRVERETQPLRMGVSAASEREELAAGEPLEVRTAALLAFATGPAVVPRKRSDWRPREYTGITSEQEGDVE